MIDRYVASPDITVKSAIEMMTKENMSSHPQELLILGSTTWELKDSSHLFPTQLEDITSIKTHVLEE